MARSVVLLLAIFAVAAIIVIVWLFGFRSQSQKSSVSPTPAGQIQVPQATQTATVSAPQKTPGLIGVRVSILKTGFSPKEVKIVKGSSVTWINTDIKNHEVRSNPHPIHTDYPPLNTIEVLKPGEEKSLVFSNSGTYSYHDHLNPSNTAKVIVE